MFLLHFVGDFHQPLHAAEHKDARGHGDQGGNLVNVVTGTQKNSTNLHSYWDSSTVKRLGSSPETIAPVLIKGISAADVAQWQAGSPSDWAMESFAVARDVAYGQLPKRTRACAIRSRNGPPTTGRCRQLTQSYVLAATGKARHQLQIAGVRLAFVVHQSLRLN